MLDTTAPCTCCADVWAYVANHLDPSATLTSTKESAIPAEEIPALYADLTACLSDYEGDDLPITVEHLERYIRGDY
jgi:hypothetical protein